MEVVYDYIEKNKPKKAFVDIETQVRNPELHDDPELFISPNDMRKLLNGADDKEFHRLGVKIGEWYAIFNQEFRKR